MKTKTLALLAILLFASFLHAQQPQEDGITIVPLPFTVWSVDARFGSDSNSGVGSNNAFKRITKALSVAQSGDYIYVNPGHYDATYNGEVFPMVIPSGVHLISNQGPQVTEITAAGANKPVIEFNGASSTTSLSGFHIRGGRRYGVNPLQPAQGGGVTCRNNSAAIIENNIIAANYVYGGPGTAQSPKGGIAEGAGVFVDASSTCVVRNNVITSNVAEGGVGYTAAGAGGKGGTGRGAGVAIVGSATLVQNTIVDNIARGGKGGASMGGLSGGSGGDSMYGAGYITGLATVANNIFHENWSSGGQPGTGTPNGFLGTPSVGGFVADNSTVTNNLIGTNTPVAGQTAYPNTTYADPQIVNWRGELRITSPAKGGSAAAYQSARDIKGITRVSPATIGAHEAVTRYDCNRDGTADLIWRHTGSGENAVWLMNGSTIVQSALIPNLDPAWQNAGTGDFDRDGKNDILWRNPATGQNAIWFLDGAAIKSTVNIAAEPDLNLAVAGVGDFNNDGAADILWRNSFNGDNKVWFMSGASVLRKRPYDPLADLNWKVAGVADYGNEGGTDILWRNQSTGQTQIWRITGDQVITKNSPMTKSSQWIVAGSGDFTGDGSADIVWRNTVTGENTILDWDFYPSGQTEMPTTTVGDQAWSIAKAGDMNADGKADLLWRHANTGELAVWLMDGGNVVAATILGVGVADPGWKVAQ